MAKSVATKFSTTPEEEIFGVDPFAAMANTTLNTIVGKSGSFGNGISNLMGAAGNIATAAGIVSFVSTGKLDKDYIVDKLGSTLKIDTTFLAKTPIANAGKLLQSMGLVDEKTANLLTGKDSSMSLVDIYTTAHNGYKTTVKNVKKVGDGFEQMGKDFEKYIKDDLFDSFSSFTNALNSINPEIANFVNTIGMGEELALLRDVVNQSVALEIPGLVDSIIRDIKDEDVQKAVLVQALPNAVDNGNLELMAVTLDLVSADTITGIYPEIVNDILKGYKDSTETINLTLAEKGDVLFGILDKIDPKWLYTVRNGTEVYNLDVFKTMSDSAKKITIHSNRDDVRTLAMIGHHFKPEAPLVVAKRYYPYL